MRPDGFAQNLREIRPVHRKTPDAHAASAKLDGFTPQGENPSLSSTLYQYRDIDQREIDFIIENDDGDLTGIEVKAGSGVGKDDFKNLVWFRDHLARSRHFVGIVLYSGSQVLSFGNGMLAVPISALWRE